MEYENEDDCTACMASIELVKKAVNSDKLTN